MDEDFESSDNLLAGWSEITSVLGNHWEFSPVNNSHYLVIPNHSNYASINEGYSDTDYNGEYLITPAIDLLDFSYVFMSLDVFFKSMSYQEITEQASIEFTFDGGIRGLK